ncbi:MAG: SDR family oxidoreductase [Leptospirales bacterium]|nr:SDR family oxidoreductase [Leptospirales bacterium]
MTKTKTILITGATSGIGQACAERLAKRGHRVFGTGRSVRSAMESKAGVTLLPMDVNSDASVRSAIAEIEKDSGRLDVLVNNAGYAVMGAVEDTSMEEARQQMETNFFGALRLCQAVLPIMRRQRSGTIVNISSLAGVLGLPFSGLYSASKFALEGMSESLRWEVKGAGIRVVLIEPGDFNTQLPAHRRFSSDRSGGAYREALAKFKANQDRDEAKAPSPEAVARLLARIVESRSVRLRYTVGMPGQTIVAPLKKLLPGRLFDGILAAALGL